MMLPAQLLAAAALAAMQAGSAGLEGVHRAAAILRGDVAPAASYAPDERAVTNWREEAVAALNPAPLAWLTWLAPDKAPFVSRCVRLDNYWCIKRAGWAGEIGADDEDHTAFARAEDGAFAAATLLRRYYREYGRRSALAIVRRWAPAECGSSPPGVREPVLADASLAVHGLRRTLRARFLARHGRGGQALRRGRPRLAAGANPRIQPFSPLARLAGAPRRPPRPAGARPVGGTVAALVAKPAVLTRVLASDGPEPSLALALPALLPPAPLCRSDAGRIANYAARIAASLGLGPNDDLRLFDGAGRPLAGLAPVMLAMSAVELGTFRASPDLVAAAIARLGPLPEAAAGPP